MGYQSIYDRLRAAELTEAGALAMLGNWDCESNCESVRLQGDFSSYRTVSKQYASDVDSGRISRDSFKNDQKGFGLAQWTYFTRKAALYDFARAKGKSIGDESMQVDFALLELRSDFSGLLNELKSPCSRTDSQLLSQSQLPSIASAPASVSSAARRRS